MTAKKPSFSRDYIVRPLLILILLAAHGAVLLSCYTAPVTGRSQLILLSQSEENQMGVAAFQEVLKTEKVSTNAKYNQAVTDVGMRIAAVADTPNYKWDFKVIEDNEQINAFALPGGKVAVYTGLLPVAQNEAGLATVMAHEVAHVAARHGGGGGLTGHTGPERAPGGRAAGGGGGS